MRMRYEVVVGSALCAVWWVGCGHSATAPTPPPPAECSYVLSTSSQSVGAEGGQGTLGITTGSACSWSAEAAESWITLEGARTGTGPGTVTYAVESNPTTAERIGTVRIAGQVLTITQNSHACTYAVTPGGQTFPPAGGTGSLKVSAPSGCPWTAVASEAWVSLLAGSSGTGDGVVSYSIAAHTGPTERLASVTIAGRQIVIRQSPLTSCSPRITPASQSFGIEGGRGRIAVDAPADCRWTVRADASWIRIDAPPAGEGTGAGEVRFSVDPNASATGRSGGVSIGGRRVDIRQDGASLCEYAVSPTAVGLHWHGTQGMSPTIGVTTGGGCPWTAARGASWIDLVGRSSQSGSGSIGYSVGHYTAEATRSAPIMVRWPTATAGQNAWVTQEGCRYAVGPKEQTLGAAGGHTNVLVFGDPVSPSCSLGCPWAAVSNASWITLTSGTPGAGDNNVYFTVSANPGSTGRVGTITIAGLTHTVRQKGVGEP